MANGFGHRDLLFLGRGGVHQFHGAAHDVWSVEIGKKIGELDIFRAIVGGEVLIDLGDDSGLLLVGRRSEADEDKGVGAEEIEAGLQIELAVVELKQRTGGSFLMFLFAEAGEGEKGCGFRDGIAFANGLVCPAIDRLFLDGGAGGEAHRAVFVIEVFPGDIDGIRALGEMEFFE